MQAECLHWSSKCACIASVRPKGQAIRAIREARGMSIRALQSETGLNRGYLSRLERGLVREPGEQQVRRVATALRVPVDVITEETP
ncbi:helix-turn-helix domain-containing protein [Streptomyces sp. p1417]|uniref:Helix-turn-helix domain-containing protein n=1 Tax=Streptomyces typhae TaxID=2681492 RepID=A0A6L6X256_9ACTN|nr:helix-turn-helix domain-containing protein [Streptomyces typhae]